MAKQEVFDFVVMALREQGEPSVGDDASRRYRGPRGLKCAIGHLIPDELYDPSIEGNSVATRIVQSILPKELQGAELAGLLSDLQVAHDCSALKDWVDNFNSQVSSIAEWEGLQYVE